jgi:hypothetical protein
MVFKHEGEGGQWIAAEFDLNTSKYTKVTHLGPFGKTLTKFEDGSFTGYYIRDKDDKWKEITDE